MITYLGKEIPKLGFGLMRLPTFEDGTIDIEQLKQMVDEYMANGFYYFDTAYGYHNGESEKAAKVALVDRYPRESYMLATKLPAWAGPQTAEEAKQMLYTSLERTGAGYFDFYLLHNLGEYRTEAFEKFGIWDFLREKKKEGLIRHLGFSFHDSAEKLEELLNANPDMEFVQLQINYADWENSMIQSRACYEVARKHGKPVIVMEPVRGGQLANLPPQVEKIFTDANADASLSSWAIRYAASMEGIITVLSGMSNLEQLRDNMSYMKDFQPLTDSERAVVAKAQEALAAIPQIPCTNCQYCVKGCPMGINIPGTFKAMNMINVYDNVKGAKGSYAFATKTMGKASECVACGQCEGVCPSTSRSSTS